MLSVASVLEDSARRYPDRVAIISEGSRWTYAELDAAASRLAGKLARLGLNQGDRVALTGPNGAAFVAGHFGIIKAGMVTVPLNMLLTEREIAYHLGDSGARACFVESAAYAQTIESFRERVPALLHVWGIESGGGSSLEALRAAGAEVTNETVTQRSHAAQASDIATIIYTSGTTGRPKGCELTHQNLLSDVRNAFLGPLTQIATAENPSTLLFLPLAHVFARIIQVGCIEGGIVLGHCADLNALLPSLGAFQPSFILAVPRVFEKVYNSAEQRAVSDKRGPIFKRAAEVAIAWSRAQDGPGRPAFGLRAQHALFDRLVYGKLRAALGGRAQYAVSGGAAMTERLLHFFRGVGVTVLEGYGLTETTAATTVNRPDRIKIGTVGQPLPGVGIKIAEDGEILIRGANVFPGYWQNDAATKEAFAEDGWFRTGDVGELDDEGFLKITGRKKELIVTAGGKNVSPTVLEDRLRSHALISQCMVVGDGRPFIGVLITLDQDAFGPWKAQHGKPADATVAQLKDDPDLIAEVQSAVDDANKAVSRAESIRKFRILDTDFTQESGQLTVKLGIRRNVLMKEFAADVDALYS